MLKYLTFALCCLATTLNAQGLIRDAEMERALRQIAKPILQSAGLSPDRIRILVINDASLNAFVTDSRHMFIHSGLIQRVQTVEGLQAVIAHEAAHIANGHLTRRSANARVASQAAAIGLALAIAAAAKGEGQAAAGIAIGSQSSAQRLFFAHTRAEEASADQSGLRYMARAGVDPQAMADVMDLFRGQEALRPGRQDPYAMTHPQSADRLRAIRGFVAGLKGKVGKADPETGYWFARMDAKLQGFLQNPRTTLRSRAAKGEGETAILRRAIAYHQTPDPKKALSELAKLLKKRPRDPFYHELQGEILLTGRNVDGAITAYRNAVKLAPREPLILSGLGRAYLAKDTSASIKEALRVLRAARDRDAGDPGILRNLAVAYAKSGQTGMASVVTAERFAIFRRWADAETQAKRASALLPRGSAGWLRAEDVLASVKRAKR